MKNQVKINIEKAEQLLLGANKTKFDMIYPFSNENLTACLANFNFHDKDCLTVLGSGDQALEMAYRGGKH